MSTWQQKKGYTTVPACEGSLAEANRRKRAVPLPGTRIMFREVESRKLLGLVHMKDASDTSMTRSVLHFCMPTVMLCNVVIQKSSNTCGLATAKSARCSMSLISCLKALPQGIDRKH
eukprot:scaffold8609_cov14-Tisochrysis_lutea.AAC.1